MPADNTHPDDDDVLESESVTGQKRGHASVLELGSRKKLFVSFSVYRKFI